MKFVRWGTGVALAVAVLVGVGVSVAPSGASAASVAGVAGSGSVVDDPDVVFQGDNFRVVGTGEVASAGAFQIRGIAKTPSLRIVDPTLRARVFLNGKLHQFPRDGILIVENFSGDFSILGKVDVLFSAESSVSFQGRGTGKGVFVGRGWYSINGGRLVRWSSSLEGASVDGSQLRLG